MNTPFLRKEYLKSPMREGILCWYPFVKGADVFYRGKALSDLFVQKGLRVDTSINSKYDYVVIMDPDFPDGFSADSFVRYKNLLKQTGKLLFIYENPYGMRYFAGKLPSIEPMVYSYESLYGRAVGVSRAECLLRMKQAGFKKTKSYYPMTDHWYTEVVYSEKRLPNPFLDHRLIPYIDSAVPLNFDERFLYNEVIRNGAFEFLCSSYLIEASIDSEPCEIDYVTVTAYRDSPNRFATVLCSNDKVKKIPLTDEAKAKAVKLVDAHNKLKSYGANVLQLMLDSEGNVNMRRVSAQTLIDYWCERDKEGILTKEEVLNRYDEINKTVKRTSVNGECFCELVPANCFIENDKLIFFDQEFSFNTGSPKEAADLAITRAILALTAFNHSYFNLGIKDNEFVYELTEILKSRYGLSEKWDELVKEAKRITVNDILSDGREILTNASQRVIERSEAVQETAREAAREAAYIPCVLRLKDKGVRTPLLYGCGRRGKALLKAFKDEDVFVSAIVDKDEKQLQFISGASEKFTSLSEALKKHKYPMDAIIISPLDFEPILKEIKAQIGTELPIYTLTELQEEVKNGI